MTCRGKGSEIDVIDYFKEKAKKDPRRIVFPEGDDERILIAGGEIVKEDIAKPILLGNIDCIQKRASKLGIDLKKITIHDPSISPNLDRYATAYCEKRQRASKGIAERLIKRNLFFGAMMVAQGAADGMVCGVAHTTAAVLQAAGLVVGFEKGISSASSFIVMVLPEYLGEKNKTLIFADPAVTIDPTPQQLAEIAIISGRNAKRLLGMDPKIALLSFSTKGSASHSQVDRVAEATRTAKERAPDLFIDGELQVDAALVPEVAERKAKDSGVAGSANVLVFPDLDAANIAYKLVQCLANARAYGPFLQGFARPISDLSRGAGVEDIVGVTAVTAVEAQESKRKG